MRVKRFTEKILNSYWFWYGTGVSFALLGSQFQTGPGYMDAAYYAVGGLQLFEGKGFVEPFIWNYLSDPKGLPAPAFVYWMPLPSLLVYVGMKIGHSTDFFWAKFLFLLLSGLLPVLSVYVAKRLLNNSKFAWIAGGIAAVPGVYSLYLAIPETFVPCIVGGGVFLIMAFWVENRLIGGLDSLRRFFLLGLIAGWMHLTRADGLIWLFSALGLVIWRIRPWRSGNEMRVATIGVIVLVVGYLILAGGWYYRNWKVFGSLFPPGNSKSLWLTNYNQLYSFKNDQLTLTTWLESGWSAISQARLNALSLNLQNALVVQGSIALMPLILVGIWKRRNLPAVKFVFLMWLIILGIMTVLFPYAGSRGGFLHSGASLQIFFWSLAVAGLEEAILWMKKMRGWNISSGMILFGTFLVLLNLFIAVWFFYQRVFENGKNIVWNESIEQYQKTEKRLRELKISNSAIGMVNNPPGFYWATRRPSIVIPDGDISQTLAAANRYGASYLLLELNQENLSDLYQNPRNLTGVRYIDTFDGIHYFLILVDRP